METSDNLRAAYEGECKAYFKYLSFAKIAEKEGRHEIARLFEAVAEAEAVHAMRHFEVMGEYEDTEKNLISAIDNETFEFTQMYPAFIDNADAENNTRAALSFKQASAVEKIHNTLYSRALEYFGRNKETEYHVCEICGNTVTGHAPAKCAICGAGLDKFRLVR